MAIEHFLGFPNDVKVVLGAAWTGRDGLGATDLIVLSRYDIYDDPTFEAYSYSEDGTGTPNVTTNRLIWQSRWQINTGSYINVFMQGAATGPGWLTIGTAGIFPPISIYMFLDVFNSATGNFWLNGVSNTFLTGSASFIFYNPDIFSSLSAAAVGDLNVLEGATPIPDGTTTPRNFGGVTVGGAVAQKTFTVENLGDLDVAITSITVPTGFDIDASSELDGGADTISGGTSKTLVVNLLTASVGSKTGNITINSDDPDEGTYTFAVSGTVYTPYVEYDISYTYDAVGNRLTKVDVHEGTTTYVYDRANQLTSETSPLGTIDYTYDRKGNRIQKDDPLYGITNYTYDSKSRMTSATTPDLAVTTLIYNAADQLVEKQSPDGVRKYVYDGKKLLLETKADDSTELTYDFALTEEYGELTSRYHDDTAGTDYYQYDGLGSTETLSDEAEADVDVYRYKAFGQIVQQFGTEDNQFTFVGRQGYAYYPELELYFAGISGGGQSARAGQKSNAGRLLESPTGRFLTQDPIRDDEENLYRPVGNNPVNNTDPSGLEILTAEQYEQGAKGLFNSPPVKEVIIYNNYLAKLREYRKQLAKRFEDLGDKLEKKAKETGKASRRPSELINGPKGAADQDVCCEMDLTKEVDEIERLASLFYDTYEAAELAWVLAYDAGYRQPDFTETFLWDFHISPEDGQYDRIIRRSITIGNRLGDQAKTLQKVETTLKVTDTTLTIAGFVLGGGLVIASIKEGGKRAVIKICITTAASLAAEQFAERAARRAGVSEQTIGGIKLAVAIVSYIILKRRIARVKAPGAPKGSMTPSNGAKPPSGGSAGTTPPGAGRGTPPHGGSGGPPPSGGGSTPPGGDGFRGRPGGAGLTPAQREITQSLDRLKEMRRIMARLEAAHQRAIERNLPATERLARQAIYNQAQRIAAEEAWFEFLLGGLP